MPHRICRARCQNPGNSAAEPFARYIHSPLVASVHSAKLLARDHQPGEGER
ncbi:hypothetical protein PC128_g22751, partial [Phytophthora cactorum]